MCSHGVFTCMNVTWRSKVDVSVFLCWSPFFFEAGSLTEQPGQLANEFQGSSLSTHTPELDLASFMWDLDAGPHTNLQHKFDPLSIPQLPKEIGLEDAHGRGWRDV